MAVHEGVSLIRRSHVANADQLLIRKGARSSEFQAVASPELGQVLQEQIEQALRPTIADFRKQVAATVRREVDEALHRDGQRPGAKVQQGSDRGEGHEQSSLDRSADDSADERPSEGSESAGQRGIQAVMPLHGKPLLAALPEMLEQHGEQWLRSRLDLGLDLVFSGPVRAGVQQKVERILQTLVRVALATAPEGTSRDALRTRADELVGTVTRDALDAIFADAAREDLLVHGGRAIHALFHLDRKSIVDEGLEAIKALFERLLAVLQEYWDQALRLLVRAVAALLQGRLTTVFSDALASGATATMRKAGRNGTACLNRNPGEGIRTGQHSAIAVRRLVGSSIQSAISKPSGGAGGVKTGTTLLFRT